MSVSVRLCAFVCVRVCECECECACACACARACACVWGTCVSEGVRDSVRVWACALLTFVSRRMYSVQALCSVPHIVLRLFLMS